jgi:cation/acetate symporter
VKERGIVAGIWTGLLSSILLILISPTVMGASAIFPLENPGIVSIPLSLAVTVILSMTGEKTAPVTA